MEIKDNIIKFTHTEYSTLRNGAISFYGKSYKKRIMKKKVKEFLSFALSVYAEKRLSN